MASNYYLILGVDCDATPDEIKSAYRRQAKRLHPDIAGGGSEPFREVQEAYEVLGDAGRRRTYDDELLRDQRRARQTAPVTRREPVYGRRPPAEPLVPTRRPDPDARFRPAPPCRPVEPHPDLGGDWPGPAGRRPGTRGAAEVHVRVSLTPEQAQRGGTLRIWLAEEARCPSCGGWGRVAFFGCPHCHGSGSVVDEHPVDIAYPGGVAGGAEGTVSLRHASLGRLDLRVHFEVDRR